MAVRLLVLARDAPVPDSPGAWRKGDVVVAARAGHVWGRRETLPSFVQIDVEDADRADIASLLAESVDVDNKLVARRSKRLSSTEVDDAAKEPNGRRDRTKADIDVSTEDRTLSFQRLR